MFRRKGALLLLAPLALAAQQGAEKIGQIEFFGYGKLDPAVLRQQLPFKAGDPLPGDLQALRASIKRISDRKPSDVAVVCCNAQGEKIIYLGLAKQDGFDYLKEPKGKDRLSDEANSLYDLTMKAVQDAVQRGVSGEDESQGFSISEDAVLRERQLSMRVYALAHEKEIRRVLKDSGDSGQRATAATFLGYAQQSKDQIEDLLRAVHDSNDEVRNNATRAIAVLAASNTETARKIPFDDFVEMLRSGIWTDRNKAAFVLTSLTTARDPKLLKTLRDKAMGDLVEMARWNTGHATMYRIILGRIAGIPDNRLIPMATQGNPDEIIHAAQASRD